jgi:hypothetical protein
MSLRWVIFALLLLVAGCGTPGAPQPPSLRLPKPVEDLKAVRHGDKVLLTWTSPAVTTDGDGIRGAATARICRSFRTQPEEGCRDKAADVPSLAGKKAAFTDDLTPSLANRNQDFVTYNVEVLNERGRAAEPSNPVTIFLSPAMPAPTEVTATLERDAVVISWVGTEPPPQRTLRSNFLYRVTRSLALPGEGTTPDVVVGEGPAKAGPAMLRDKNFVWERKYEYRVVGLTQVLSREGKLLAEFTGESASPAEVDARDVYPPSVPQGVRAVYSGDPSQRSIDLTWSPNEDNDLAGYNVYRREGNAPAVRVNKELVKTPSYRDTQVQPGKTYSYVITAVDARNNEGQKSQPADEKVPE